MKSLYRITKLFLPVLAVSLAMMSCSEDLMDDINRDINNPQDVDAKLILTDVITSTAFSNVGGDINTYTSAYVEHETGTHNQLFRAEHRESEPTAASTFNNAWNSLYGTLRNARIIIDKTSEGGPQEGNNVTRGMAEVLAAYNSALIADLFGDAPWSEAAEINPDGTPANMNPKIDTQQEIYAGVMAYLDAAIADLGPGSSDEHASGGPRSNDLLYGGDQSLWLKFAYGLKARYTMRLLARSANPTADLEQVLNFAALSFTSPEEQAAFSIYDASNLNPLFDFQWSRDGLAASQSMSEKLIERNDPRLRRVFVSANWEQMPDTSHEDFFMAPNGLNQEIQYFYNTSVFVFSQTAPTMLLSYHELQFLKAEAMVRLGRTAEARVVLRDAVVAGLMNAEASVQAAMTAPTILGFGGLSETTDPITVAEAESYFDTEAGPLFDADPLREVMIQKYIAFFGASGESTEAYNDIRRLRALNQNFIELKNPNNSARFPLRLPYGSSDTTTNPEVQEAYGNGQYVYSDPVWWAGGSD